MTVNVRQARTQLSRLLDLLEEREEIIILCHGRPVARLVRPRSLGKPQLGAMRGEIAWKEGWECPLSPGEAEAFWNGRW